MSPLRRLVLAALVGSAVAAPTRWALPLVEGELAGDFTALKFSAAPVLHWTLALHSDRATGGRTGSFEITGEGTRARGEVRADATGEITWHLAEARLDLARWSAALDPVIGAQLAGASLSGALLASGDGAWHEGRMTARFQIAVRDAAIHGPQNAWSISGVALDGALTWPQLASDGAWRATFREATSAGVSARDGQIEFVLDPRRTSGAASVAGQVRFATSTGRTIRVTSAQCRLMDGRVALAPFTVALAKPDVKTQLSFAGVQLGGLAKFLPAMLAEARGPVSGKIDVGWTRAGGLVFADGTLQPRETEFASVRLAPSPGFFTARLPAHVRERIDLVPDWLGPIKRWFAPKNPAYDTLRAIEMGEMPLQVQAVDVHVQPEGDANGRTARIVVSARPAVSGSAVDSIHFEINVTGPLADFVRLALEGRLSVHAR